MNFSNAELSRIEIQTSIIITYIGYMYSSEYSAIYHKQNQRLFINEPTCGLYYFPRMIRVSWGDCGKRLLHLASVHQHIKYDFFRSRCAVKLVSW